MEIYARDNNRVEIDHKKVVRAIIAFYSLFIDHEMIKK